MTAALAPTLVAALLALPGGASPAAGDAAPARYVIVVGYNGPPAGERPALSWADDDAARLYRMLLPGARRAWLLTEFDLTSARLWGSVVDAAAPPTRQELARVLGEAFWAMRDEPSGAELVFAFAGHGDVSAGGEGFAVLADGPFLRSDLERQLVAASPARVNHILIDACAAYFLVGRGAHDQSVPVTSLLESLTRPGADAAAWARTGVLVATNDAAEVHESAAVGGGVFSFLVRSALAGAADANRDGRVEYAEAAAFIAAASGGIDDPRARLAIHARAPAQSPHAPLIDMRTAGYQHFLVVDERAPVHVRLLDSRGLPYAEVHSEASEAPLVLALAGDPFYVVERGAREAVLVPRSAGAYALSSLVWSPLGAPRSVDPRAAQLFATQYGPAFLGGFLADDGHVGPADGERFAVPWAASGAPPPTPPWATLAWTSAAAAGVLGSAAGVALAGNAFALADLEARFRETGTLDPALSLQTDTWLTAALVLGGGAAAAAALGGGFFFLASQEGTP
ncbi:MAG: caspase family protein [Deltaproteobacteria bacterium]|nr:caspase family protein [Deltaproteobacteria bacterium]